MIPGPALAEWIADDAAQQRSQARVEACAVKWGDHPIMEQIVREVGLLDRRSPENLLAAARRFMDRTQDIDAMMADFIASCGADPFFRPPFLPITHGMYNSLVLYQHPELSIGLGVTSVSALAAKKTSRTGAASVNFTGYVLLLRFVKAGGATLSVWEAPRITDDFRADIAGQCRRVEVRQIEDGDEIVIDGRYQSFVIEHATSDMVYFQAVARSECAPVCAEYDADSGAFVGASGTDDAGSRVQMMASLLRAMERDDALPLLAEGLDNWQFHTRWHVMREMLAMDAEAALPRLQRMATEDPHLEVRAAARQTLDMFFADTAEAGDGEVLSCRA